MTTILMSDTLRVWLADLRDQRAEARIVARIRAAGFGQFGDIEPVGGGVYEMRIAMGPGYRLHDVRRGEVTDLLLVGGDTSTQSRDIRKAMAADLDGSVRCASRPSRRSRRVRSCASRPCARSWTCSGSS